jgi:Asp-tRNA(Asn)/Glu-tRNA(Gln) amidotransferase C subunit
MAEQMEGLSFEISQTGAEDSAKSLNTLASALTRLASASSKLNTNSLQSQATQISSLVDSLSKVDAEGVGKSLESLKNSLNDFSKIKSTKSLSTTAENVRRLMESLNSIQGTDKIRQVSSVLSDLSNISKNGISTKLATGLDKLSVAMKNVSSDDIARLERLRDVLKDMSGISSLPNLRGITANNLSANSGKTENNSIADTNPKEQDTSSVTVTASRYAQVTKALSSIQSAAKGVKSSLVGIFTNPQAAANSFSGTVQKLGSAFNKVALGIPTKAVSGLGSAFKSASTKVSGFLSSIGRIAMYRAVRAAIAAITQALKTGINNLYQYSSLMGTTFAGSMDSLATSAQYLTNSLGAMAAPLIQAVAPAIEYVINKIVELLNWFNMLIARLTGSSTATVAKRAATSFGDVGSSAGNAAGSVAELQKTILGFDEINALNDNSSGGSGGGSGSGSGSDYGSMFEEVPIDAAVSDFADALKAAFDAGEWETLGTLLADKVNGIVDSIDFKGIGKKIGYGLNGAIQTAYYFLEKVNFENIGAGIAEMLNGALSEIDGEFIGRLIVRWFTAGWDFVIGFLKQTG